jgi:hypothetical protein
VTAADEPGRRIAVAADERQQPEQWRSSREVDGSAAESSLSWRASPTDHREAAGMASYDRVPSASTLALALMRCVASQLEAGLRIAGL